MVSLHQNQEERLEGLVDCRHPCYVLSPCISTSDMSRRSIITAAKRMVILAGAVLSNLESQNFRVGLGGAAQPLPQSATDRSLSWGGVDGIPRFALLSRDILFLKWMSLGRQIREGIDMAAQTMNGSETQDTEYGDVGSQAHSWLTVFH